MKSIKRNFYKEQKRDPNIGKYIALVRAVKGKGYSRRTLGKNIYLLGDSDIDASMKKQLVEHLYGESKKVVEECKNEDKNTRDSEVIEFLSIESFEETEAC